MTIRGRTVLGEKPYKLSNYYYAQVQDFEERKKRILAKHGVYYKGGKNVKSNIS